MAFVSLTLIMISFHVCFKYRTNIAQSKLCFEHDSCLCFFRFKKNIACCKQHFDHDSCLFVNDVVCVSSTNIDNLCSRWAVLCWGVTSFVFINLVISLCCIKVELFVTQGILKLKQVKVCMLFVISLLKSR